jgi:hypothetical protein
LFRSQETSDFGIDAHVEITRDEQATGELVALQIKGGSSAFKSPTEDGWYFPVAAKHADYWLNHSLPVLLVLVDLESRQCFWQIIDANTLISTGKNFKVHVPRANDVSTASDEWQALTSRYLENTDLLYEINSQRLPPAAVVRLDELRKTDSRAAASLAAALAAGRGNPRQAIAELLRSRRTWLDRHGAVAWAAVALYAREHAQFQEAADAFVRLADLRPETRATALGDAALMLLNIDETRALELAESAHAHDPSDSAALVAMAFLRPADAQFAEELIGRTDLRSIAYFANMAVRRGHDSDAIRLFTSILNGPNEQSAVRLELSRLHCRRHLSAHPESGDLKAARDFAFESLTARRRWTNETDGALAAYARTLALDSRYHEALQTVTQPPTGTASKSEAASTEVALIALDVARRLERFDLLPGIVEVIADPTDRELAAEEARLAQDATSEELIAHQRMMLSRALDAGDAQLAFRAGLDLALHGVDESVRMTELEPLKTYAELVRAIAAARDDPAGTLPKLRVLAKTEITAAEIVIQILLDLDRYHDAAEACDLYFAIYANASFISSKVKALFLDDDEEAALALLNDALAKSLLAGQPLYEAHRLLGQHYGDLQQWDLAVHHFRELVARSPTLPRDGFWNLLQSLVAMGDPQGARALLDELRLDPETEPEIKIWLRVVTATGWTESTASFAVTLSLSADITPELATSLVGTVILDTRGTPATNDDDGARASDARPLVDRDIHRRAFEVMQALIDEHGDHLAIRTVDADVGALVDELKRTFPPERVKPLRALARQVAGGTIPIGFLSELRNDPYGLLLSDRYLQVRIASSPDSADHASETEAALAALNGRIVVDLSAVELAIHLDAWSECEGQFNVVAISTAQRTDAQMSVATARSATGSGGTLGVDVDGNPYMTEFDPAAQLATLRRCEDLERATRGLLTIDVGQELRFATALNGLGLSAWVTSLEAAGRQRVALWSDDFAQRRLAKELGIPTFGTVNILEGLRLSRLDESATTDTAAEVYDEQRAFVRRLLELRVADQPVTVDDLIDNVAQHPADLAPASDVIARAAWWRADAPAEGWTRILQAVRVHAPNHLRVWQARAMSGILSAAPADAAPRLVAALAVRGTLEPATVADVIEGFRVGDEVCAHHENSPASAHVAWAVAATASELDGLDLEELTEQILAGLQSPV